MSSILLTKQSLVFSNNKAIWPGLDESRLFFKIFQAIDDSAIKG